MYTWLYTCIILHLGYRNITTFGGNKDVWVCGCANQQRQLYILTEIVYLIDSSCSDVARVVGDAEVFILMRVSASLARLKHVRN